MNKNEFKEFLKNKKVILKNASEIKLLALQEKNKLIKFYLNQFNLLIFSNFLKKYNRINEVLVRSTDFKINDVIFNFKDIEILSDTVFISKNTGCIFEVIK